MIEGLKEVTITKQDQFTNPKINSMVTISITTPCLKDFPGLHHMRIPVCNSASPTEADFDILVQTLVGTTINCPVIISDQVTAD